MDIGLFKKQLYHILQRVFAVLFIFTLVFTDISTILQFPFVPEVSKAEAATGDFSIFRENTGTETVSSTTLGVSWDTTVSASGNLSLQPNNSDIDLSEGGKYLVMYNVWTEQGTSTAALNRRSQLTWLTLAGTELPYGRGGGYLRDSNNVLYMYNSGAAIVDAVAGDDLRVNIRRDEQNPVAGTNIRPASNGVSVLKLKDSWDYLRIYKTASSSDIDPNTTFTAVTWDTSDEVGTGSFGFTPTSGDITLKGDDNDHFLITANVKLNKTLNGTRENYEMILTLEPNGGGTAVEIPGTRVTSFVRGTQTDGDDLDDVLVYSGIIRKDDIGDQTLNVEVRRESTQSGGVTVIVGDQTALTAVALPDEGSYIMLGDSVNSAAANGRTDMGFNTQYEVDSYAFSHSTTTASSSVNIDRAGDYLFFSTVYGVNTSNDRQPFRIDWQKNGSTLLNYGSYGAYVRGNQSFSGGASGGLIMNGLTASDYIGITQFDETGTPADLTFQGNRVALQGVLLDENFFGVDVLVSATGTHSVETDIPTTDFYGGGGFVIAEQTGSRNITSITITESGTVDAQNGLDNIKLYYDLDTTGADGYDCSSESYSGTETQFGSTDTNGFSGADGVSSFSDSVAISTTQSMCVYVIYDASATSTDGNTVILSINDPSADVVGSGSPTIGPVISISPTASTTLRNAELTQTNYNWRNDDGTEVLATSIEQVENVPTIGFANGTTRRLRLGVSAEGSTSSLATQYRLEYAQKISTCSAVSSWTDVGTGGGGDWDIINTGNLTDGNDTTNVATQALGGITDPSGGSFLTPNGGQKDTSSQTGNITFASGQFTELEYALEPTLGAPQGNTYCFRVSDAGTALRNYTNYPEGTISADIDVSASSSQVTSLDLGSTGQYVGGTFVIERPGTVRTLTDITITETGTIDAQTNLTNSTLYYDLDVTTPFDCTGESYSGFETSVAGSAFSGTNGSSSFTTLGLSLSSTQAFCGYIVFDVGSGASDGETINIEIADPSADVVVTTSSVGPSTSVSPTGSTTVAGPVPTQTHIHWRNDNGDETDTGAASASGGTEDTAIIDIPKVSTRRLRLQVSNEGAVTTAPTNYRLEYGTKITTCGAIASWNQVGVGSAFATSSSAFIADGNTTNINNFANGAMTEPIGKTFFGTGALRETTSESGSITLSSTQYTELEYSIEATDASGFNTDYCFRVTDSGTPLVAYDNYAEMTTRQKQDFFIQRGTEVVTGTGQTLTAGVDYTAPSATSSAFVRITTSQMTGAGNTTGGGTLPADDVTAYISDQSDITTQFVIGRPSTAASETRVDWEIIEYIGLPGADNEMVVRGVNTISYGGATIITATGTALTTVTDDTDVVVYVTGQTNDNTSTGVYAAGLSTSFWNGTTSEPIFDRVATGTTGSVSYAVVEYTGLNWKIQRIEHNYTVAGSAQTEPISAVGSLSTAFIHAQMRTGLLADNGLDDYGHQVFLSSIGAVSFQLNSGSEGPLEHYSVAWVIENTQTGTGAMAVYRDADSVDNDEAVEPRSSVFDFNGTVGTLSNASIWITNDSTGGGIAFPRAMLGVRPTSTTQYEIFESDAGQVQEFSIAVVEWPVAELAFEQNYYLFYVDNDAMTPTDPYPAGVSNLGENASVTGSDDPLGEGDRIRIRMTLQVNNANLPESTQSFKLQYGRRDSPSCSAIAAWADLGNIGSGEIWRGYDGTPVDGTVLASTLISISDFAATYEEQNSTAVNPNAASVDEDIEFDWLVENNGATQLTDYCFRMINSDDTELAGYNNYPTLRTTGYTPIVANWRWYDDETNLTPTTPMAAENIAPIDVANTNEIKLRVTASEVESAPGTDIKFQVQYSEFADFSDGGTIPVATSSCVTNSIWCYADGAGVDNATITTALLSDADSCVAGVGVGCGTHNEAATSSVNILDQPSLSNMEFEFTLRQAGARANAVYYFRLYDVTNDVPLAASSSYPSLVTEGASLVFTMSGIDSGVVTEGITTDATTTPTGIVFGSVPIDTEYEAAQRITVDTNATQGYQILMLARQGLLNTYAEAVPAILSSNASPASWNSLGGCDSNATGCFGYHPGDDSLDNASSRFGGDDSYAAFNTTPQEVMYSSVPVNESSDIVYKIQVTGLQPAGDYQTEVVYIAVPVF